ncbi:MAG: triose-phosphate isomerase [Rhodocyclaceae bacterium]|jgi:triosephosphate isomerase|nr:triose-phosphate isomerase [Rhodocyclaceae bacterium]
MTVVRTPLVVGNWKMNGSFEANRALIEALLIALAQKTAPDVGVCPPFPYLPQVGALLAGTNVRWGAQTVCEHRTGAYTGQVSASMLRDLGCTYAIVGHSERRQFCGETDEQVSLQAVAALDSGLTPIICVGESAEEEAAGKTLAVIDRQLAPVLATLAGVADEGKGVVIAYEPVWAIGTGKTPTPEGVQAVHAHIRERLMAAGLVQTRILYGGSVKGSNAATLFALPDVDGGLIGGAALDALDFSTICTAAAIRAV